MHGITGSYQYVSDLQGPTPPKKARKSSDQSQFGYNHGWTDSTLSYLEPRTPASHRCLRHKSRSLNDNSRFSQFVQEHSANGKKSSLNAERDQRFPTCGVTWPTASACHQPEHRKRKQRNPPTFVITVCFTTNRVKWATKRQKTNTKVSLL